mgnify:CR=1 FL=1|tara:strand:+ start:298 stop:522 length:225 start_codon:yes stop_codon:yes gene_type:complete
MKKAPTQKSELIRLFKKGLWISQVKCFDLTGSTRLSAYVFILKKEGYDFDKREKLLTTRYGNRCSITEYRFKKK